MSYRASGKWAIAFGFSLSPPTASRTPYKNLSQQQVKEWKNMKFKTVTCIAAMALLIALAIPVSVAAQNVITIDAPGAGTMPGQGTFAEDINPAGAITGYYFDAGFAAHGFLRAPNGTITTFDPTGSQDTFAFSINPVGVIAGYYLDGNDVFHGFVRATNGTFTTFEAPGADTTMGSFNGTFAANINPAGAIAGDYVDASEVFHGYARAPHGTITPFDAPGAGTGAGQGTFLVAGTGINPAGAIAGQYIDAGGVAHGYVRAPDGTITPFDVTGAGTGPAQGTSNSGINTAGTNVGAYADSNDVQHGYARAPDGTITKFNVPAAGTGPGTPLCEETGTCPGTVPEGINNQGAITGLYVDASGVNHGFLRALNGSITTFDAPGAGTGSGQGTIAATPNPVGAIVGFYIDGNNVFHGFLRNP
jgi:hypothetical protein